MSAITFGIITQPSTGCYLNQILESIDNQNIDDYEVILSGLLSDEVRNNYWYDKYIEDKDSVKSGKITKLKNSITNNAKNDIIVYLHDYIYFTKDWYKNLVKFGFNWDILCNPVVNEDGSPFRSLCYWDKPGLGRAWTCYEKWAGTNGINFEGSPHFVKNFENFDYSRCYINGSYWIAKKRIMQICPLDEEIKHLEGEDVQWSLRIRNRCKIAHNPNSIVKTLKYKDLGIPTYYG